MSIQYTVCIQRNFVNVLCLHKIGLHDVSEKIYNHFFVCVCYKVLGAMANASPDLDNAEAQRLLNNNNRPIGSGFWETECTSSKLFECSRIKALAGEKLNPHTDTCIDTGLIFESLSSNIFSPGTRLFCHFLFPLV